MNKIKKKIKEVVRIQIKIGEATPAPPIGPVLGSRGINLMDFCKKFNIESTKDKTFEKGVLVSVILTIYEDKTFVFVIKTPPTSFLIKKYANVEKGSQQPSKQKPLNISYHDIETIAKIKCKDLTAVTIVSAINTIIGTARSMGFFVK